MASVRTRSDNSIWLARFVDADSKKREVSTGTPRRREAQKIADAFEAAAQRRMTVAHVQRTLRELMADATGAEVPGSSVGEFFRQWIDRRRVENARATVEFYEASAKHFLTWASSFLPQQGRTQMAAVQAVQVDAFRAELLTRLSICTVNHTMKFVRQVFDAAKREGVLLESPCALLRPIRRHVPAEVRPFTMDEVRALLVAAGDVR